VDIFSAFFLILCFYFISQFSTHEKIYTVNKIY